MERLIPSPHLLVGRPVTGPRQQGGLFGNFTPTAATRRIGNHIWPVVAVGGNLHAEETGMVN